MLGLKLNHVSKRGHWASSIMVLTRLSLDSMAAIMADDIFKYIFLKEKFCILNKISLKFIRKGPIDNNLTLV